MDTVLHEKSMSLISVTIITNAYSFLKIHVKYIFNMKQKMVLLLFPFMSD